MHCLVDVTIYSVASNERRRPPYSQEEEELLVLLKASGVVDDVFTVSFVDAPLMVGASFSSSRSLQEIKELLFGVARGLIGRPDLVVFWNIHDQRVKVA